MEVIRENFLEAFPKIEAAVAECDFIAIDAEFTGLGGSLPAKVVFDTPAQRYERLKKGLHNHIIIQYGICTFKWNSEVNRYEAKPFNIYVFPRSSKGSEIYFQCQSSSIEFLASQGFDFNKLFYKGTPKDIYVPYSPIHCRCVGAGPIIRKSLSYMTPNQEERMRKNMKMYYGANDNSKTPKSNQVEDNDSKMKSPMFIPPSLKAYVDETCSQVEAFIANEDEKVLDLAKGSRFRRKLTYEVIEERFPSKFHLESVDDGKGDKHIRIIKANEEEITRLKNEKDNAKMAEFETAVGFLKIAKVLSEARKLIIGHNMLLDLMLTIGQFFVPLPNTLEDFKEILQTFFPKLADTKLMATSKPLNEKITNSSLGGLYQFLRENFNGPDVVFSDGFEDYHENSNKYHEAGYDAYCTGYCFAAMASHLCDMQQPTEESIAIDLNAELVKAFVNRVYVMRINGLQYITIDGPDDIPERKNVFHLQYPTNWRYPEINSLFSDFGNVYIALIDDSSAFVSLDFEERAKDVIERFIIQKRSGLCQVITYMQYIGKDPLDKYDVAEERNNEKEPNRNSDHESEYLASDVNKREPKNTRKRNIDESPEEGEVADGCESSQDETLKAAVKKPKIQKTNVNKISSEKDFYEPDDW